MQPNFTSQRPKQTQTGANGSKAVPRRASSKKRERERESFRGSERACKLRCESAANDERLCFAREGTEGREGEEDKREKEISIAKKIYFNFKGLKLCDFGDLQ
jgi:hypothetical protein